MPRKLRIAVSVFFAVLTVALCVMWVRSYKWRDVIRCRTSGSNVIVFASMKGKLIAYDYVLPNIAPQWELKTIEIVNGGYFWADETQYRGILGFIVKDVLESRLLGAPHWFFILSTVAIASAPWIRHSTRFSLRTLFIATTLVAVVLGLGVWLAS
jgi:Na+/melibiose symporter-like transporter